MRISRLGQNWPLQTARPSNGKAIVNSSSLTICHHQVTRFPIWSWKLVGEIAAGGETVEAVSMTATQCAHRCSDEGLAFRAVDFSFLPGGHHVESKRGRPPTIKQWLNRPSAAAARNFLH